MSFISNWGPTTLIFVGVVFTAIGGVWSQINQSKHDSKVIELQGKTINNITGGDSFCYVDLVKGVNAFILIHKGEYPVYDLEMQVVDLQTFNPTAPTLPTPLNRVPIAYPNYAAGLNYPFIYTNSNEAQFNFFMQARNGGHTQVLKMKKVNGEWETHITVSRTDGPSSEVIFEHISPHYPPEGN
nr:hypothetical protein [uncultured Pseudodesulfovibrio sp.]